ncbi:MAG: hypothetical protein CMP71_02985 [Flavobacteriales bacterium]|nr:hypothetical protein [Flavobacteriales bacterium]
MKKKIFNFFISDTSKKSIEKSILVISLISFLIHLSLIFLANNNIVFSSENSILKSPIMAIYTPFSFILIYEIYLLIYYLPRSITLYISKQYEIIALIVIRRLFKDISEMETSTTLFSSTINQNVFIDLSLSILLFFLIYLFRKNSLSLSSKNLNSSMIRFIEIKKWIAVFLIPAFSAMAIYNLSLWIGDTFIKTNVVNNQSINNIFFADFFQVLILVDVFLLIFSFFHSDLFHKIMRNSGFIISTILLRMSFLYDGFSNAIMIISALLFGLLILYIHNKCVKENLFKSSSEL